MRNGASSGMSTVRVSRGPHIFQKSNKRNIRISSQNADVHAPRLSNILRKSEFRVSIHPENFAVTPPADGALALLVSTNLSLTCLSAKFPTSPPRTGLPDHILLLAEDNEFVNPRKAFSKFPRFYRFFRCSLDFFL
eukprot:GHVP01022533.1.p1 GENE.GHVP01022533.1~~GHVP01022533.1.p1  ORF type:complete len:156 (+),score=16.86 GHVP01022533.1:61-468(+)